MNTNQYTYFVAYAHDTGHGCVAINSAAPITSYDQISEINQVIATKQGIDTVVTGYQLLSGPTETTGTDSNAEALNDLHNRLSRALDNATADRRSGGYSKESILDSLTGHVREVRASLGALTNH